jgi:hypothetical protein
MKANEIARRRVLVGAAAISLGGFAPSAAAQQSAQELGLPRPMAYGPIHGDMLSRISNALGRTVLDSKEGIFKLIDLLEKDVFVSKEDSELLKKLVDIILNSDSVAAMAREIESIYKAVTSKTADVAAAIISIARNSVENIERLGGRSDVKKAIYIVSSDVTGALTGAAACSKLPRVFAVIGALAGAVAGSGNAAFGSSKK